MANSNGSKNGLAVKVDDLSKDFGSFRAVNQVSFEVPRGQIFGFLGPNGSGKTTTIRMLLGLLAPSEGTAMVLGHDIARETVSIRPRVGYMSQRFSLYDDLTVVENLRFYGRTYGLNNDHLQNRIAFVTEMADLQGRETMLTKNLSGGWRQRLALGAAILHEPELIFLDEPTAGVDPVSRRAFWDLLYDLADGGTTIFVTTHYMDEAEHCQSLAFIHNGDLIAQGAPGDIKANMMNGQVLELSPDDPTKAMAALMEARREGRLEVEEVALYGAQLHVVAENAQAVSPLIRDVLKEAGVEPGPVEQIMPSLEDVFIASTRRRTGGG